MSFYGLFSKAKLQIYKKFMASVKIQNKIKDKSQELNKSQISNFDKSLLHKNCQFGR